MKLPHAEIAIRAVKDLDFRERLKDRPRKTLEESFDVRVPEGVRLKVVEDSSDRVHLVVPAKPGERGKEVGTIALALDRMRKDPSFKAALFDDPKGLLEQMTGLRLPDKPRLEVLEDTEYLIHLHLPPGRDSEPVDVEPSVLTSAIYGGDGGWNGGPPPTTAGPDCTSLVGSNSSQIVCCHTDVRTTSSAWNCCFEDDLPGDVLVPF